MEKEEIFHAVLTSEIAKNHKFYIILKIGKNFFK